MMLSDLSQTRKDSPVWLHVYGVPSGDSPIGLAHLYRPQTYCCHNPGSSSGGSRAPVLSLPWQVTSFRFWASRGVPSLPPAVNGGPQQATAFSGWFFSRNSSFPQLNTGCFAHLWSGWAQIWGTYFTPTYLLLIIKKYKVPYTQTHINFCKLALYSTYTEKLTASETIFYKQ